MKDFTTPFSGGLPIIAVSSCRHRNLGITDLCSQGQSGRYCNLILLQSTGSRVLPPWGPSKGLEPAVTPGGNKRTSQSTEAVNLIF